MTVGERIQEYRKKNYMSQEELAERLDVSKQSVSKWETDKSLPNIEKIIRLCDIFEISADCLLRGENISADKPESGGKQGVEQSVEEKMDIESAENGQDMNKVASDCKMIYKILLGISIFISVLLCAAILHIVVYNNMGINGEHGQDVIRVDRIYSQYTRADVEYIDDNDNFVEKTVWLDTNGVREGDWIFCYFDAESGKIRFRYNRSTCIGLILAFVVFIIITVILAAALRKRKAHVKGAKALMCLALLTVGTSLCACGRHGNDADDYGMNHQDNIPSVMEQPSEDSNPSSVTEASYSDADDKLYKEYKDMSVFEGYGAKIVFSVPEGYYSTGVRDSEDVLYENFYSDDTIQYYDVFFSSLILYGDEEDYGRSIYTERRELEPSAEVSLWQEEVVNGNTVVYITVCYERDDTVFNYVQAGVVLYDGRVFEVTAEMLDCEGEFDFEVVRPFFENLEITPES